MVKKQKTLQIASAIAIVVVVIILGASSYYLVNSLKKHTKNDAPDSTILTSANIQHVSNKELTSNVKNTSKNELKSANNETQNKLINGNRLKISKDNNSLKTATDKMEQRFGALPGKTDDLKQKKASSLRASQLTNSVNMSSDSFNSITSQQSKEQVKTLTLNSSTLGLQGPLDIGTEYSDQSGLMIDSKLAIIFGNNRTNAFALEVDGGEKEYRIGGTFGHIITDNQQLKFTAEYLAQKLNFAFDSGDINKWVGQNAFGVDYQFIIPDKIINAVNFGGYYAKAKSEDLGVVRYISQDNGLWMDNYRRIAGATSEGLIGSIDLLPSRFTKLNLALNYDAINFHARYQDNVKDSGFWESINLEQLLTPYFKLDLGASFRKTEREVNAALAWLPINLNKHLEFKLGGSIVKSQFNFPVDRRLSLAITYSWGNADNKYATYSYENANQINDLLTWTKQPAVHMHQVLAMADQKSLLVELLPLIDPIPDDDKVAFYDQNYFFDLKSIVHFPGVTTPNTRVKKVAATPNNLPQDDTIILENSEYLPQGLTYDEKNSVIQGVPLPSTTAPSDDSLMIKACDRYGCTESSPFKIEISSGEPVIDIPDQTATSYKPFSLNLKKYVHSSAKAGKVAININKEKLPKWLLFDDQGNEPNYILHGTPLAPTTQPIEVTVNAHNNYGSANPQVLKITVSQNSDLPEIKAIKAIDGKYKAAYSFDLKPYIVDPSNQGYTLKIVSGTLPDDLNLNDNHVIEGVPVESKTATISIQATNNVGDSNIQTFSIKINPIVDTLICPSKLVFPRDVVDPYGQSTSSSGKTYKFQFYNGEHNSRNSADYPFRGSEILSSNAYSCSYGSDQQHNKYVMKIKATVMSKPRYTSNNNLTLCGKPKPWEDPEKGITPKKCEITFNLK